MNSIIDSILRAERGYWEDPIGGNTNMGITQRTLDSVRVKYPSVGLPAKVIDLTRAQAAVIIDQEYLRPFRVYDMPYPLSLVMAHGVVMAWDDIAKLLQVHLGFTGGQVDGIVGSRTIAAVTNLSLYRRYDVTAKVVQDFLDTRTNAYAKSYRTRFLELEYA